MVTSAQHPQSVLMAACGDRFDSRKSTASSGIGHDLSSGTSRTSTNYSPRTSLGIGPDASPRSSLGSVSLGSGGSDNDVSETPVAAVYHTASRDHVVSVTPGIKHTVSVPDDESSDSNSENATVVEASSGNKLRVIGNPGYSQLSDDESSNNNNNNNNTHTNRARGRKAPDGGWGWVVVAASFSISMIADGVSFSFGLLYVELLHHFRESSSRTSLVGSLFMSVPLLTGPISSALVDRYGCRSMTILGGLIAGLGLALSAFQTSLEALYVTFGLLSGLGLGLCYVTAVVSIAYWFDRRRTFATGLGACGTGVGTVVYARLTSYLLAEYGWRGTTLLLAGTFFNMCVGGALMRDPHCLPPATSCGDLDAKPAALLSHYCSALELRAQPLSPALCRSASAGSASHSAPRGRGRGKSVKRTDSLPSTLRAIRVHRNSVMYRGAMLNIHRYRLRASSCPDIFRNSLTTIAKENGEKWLSDMRELVHGMADFSMFRELHFLLMSVATVLLFTWFIVPYFYLADHAALNHYDDEQVSSLLVVIGATNFVGMVALGWAGDQPWMNVTKTYAACLAACGLATMAMPYVTADYTLLAAACALFGLFFASSFSFTPVILVQLIPIERFTTAYGLSLMCQGIGSLLGPPLAGWVYDMTRTYDLSFYLAGGWIIVAGLLVALIPVTKNRRLWGEGPLERQQSCV